MTMPITNIEYFTFKRWIYLKAARKLVKGAYPEPHLFPSAMRRCINNSEYLNEHPENQQFVGRNPKDIREGLLNAK